MQYKEKSAIPYIEAAYSTFTATEKEVAKYFLKGTVPEDFSLKSIAVELAVSEATLVRFAKKCGFKGFREFIYQYEKVWSQINQPKILLNLLFRFLMLIRTY